MELSRGSALASAFGVLWCCPGDDGMALWVPAGPSLYVILPTRYPAIGSQQGGVPAVLSVPRRKAIIVP
jgi:hypothetical protein